jgi:hypothetical protein
MSATILKLWAKLLNPYEILIAVFFLLRELDANGDSKQCALPLYTGLEPQSHQISHIGTRPDNG